MVGSSSDFSAPAHSRQPVATRVVGYRRLMQARSNPTMAHFREWVDAVQDHWEESGCRFRTDELKFIRDAARCLPPNSVGVPSVSAPEYRCRATSDLRASLDDDVEAAWELIVRVVYQAC